MKKIMHNYIKSSIDIDSLHIKYKKLMPSSWAMGQDFGLWASPRASKLDPSPAHTILRLGRAWALWAMSRAGPGPSHGPWAF